MNIDFHYSVTYLAVMMAGYDVEEATTIAHAAQYVDDSSRDMIKAELLPNLTATPTIEATTTVVIK